MTPNPPDACTVNVPLELVDRIVIARLRGRPEVTIEHRHMNDDVWAVCWMGSCLLADGTWTYEPQPSSRTDDFRATARFSFVEAVRRGYEALPGVRGQMSPHDVVAVPWPAPPVPRGGRDDEWEPCARCTETARIIESRGDPTRDDNDLVRVPRWAVEGAVFDYEKGLSDFGQRFVQDAFRTALAAYDAARRADHDDQHVNVSRDDLALVLGTKIAGIRETTAARGRLRLALADTHPNQEPA